jgi:hypothetical protein
MKKLGMLLSLVTCFGLFCVGCGPDATTKKTETKAVETVTPPTDTKAGEQKTTTEKTQTTPATGEKK